MLRSDIIKKIILIIILIISIPLFCKAEDENMTSAKSSILMEYQTGKILYENNSKEKLAPASMTKIMSMLLIMEMIDNDKLNYEDEVIISERAASMGGSQIFLSTGSKIKVLELLKGVAIASGNDAVVALAEKTYGSVENFVKKMNDKASELNLVNTVFKNPHGLDEEGHYSCAYDMALIARELIKHEDILTFTKIYEEYLTREDGSKTWLVNTNKLVRFYEGVDGLKTGFTTEAKYCLTATAKRNDMRYITVVMGEETSDIRSKDTATLLNYGFNNFKGNMIIKKDTIVDRIKFNKSIKTSYNIYTYEDLIDVIEINEEIKNTDYEIVYNDYKLPVKKGDIIGYVKFKTKDDIIKVPIGPKEDIKKANIFDYLKRNIKIIVSGTF